MEGVSWYWTLRNSKEDLRVAVGMLQLAEPRLRAFEALLETVSAFSGFASAM